MLENSNNMFEILLPSHVSGFRSGGYFGSTQPRGSCTSAVTSPNAAFSLGVINLLERKNGQWSKMLKPTRGPMQIYFYCSHHTILPGSNSFSIRRPCQGLIPCASPSLHTLSPIRRYANPQGTDLVLKSINIWKPLLFHASSIFLSCLASPEQVSVLSLDCFLVPTLLVDLPRIRQPFLCYVCRRLDISSCIS